MRRRARRAGIDPAMLTALDQLAIVAGRGMGALVYEPAVNAAEAIDSIDLDRLSRESLDVLAGIDTDGLLTTLEQLGDSSGGARPKILVAIDAAGNLRAGTGAMPASDRAWIVKFRAPRDRADAGPLEAAYADMARAAGIEVAPTTLLASPQGEFGYFATQRFDRGANGERYHVLSAAGLLETTWEIPTIDYSGLMSATRIVTRNQADVEQLFRRMVFNVVANNRDDHAKQHAFLMDETAAWRLAPAYDLTFSNGPGGEHYLTVNGHGSGIGIDDVRAVAKRQSIPAAIAASIVDEVRATVSAFDRFAQRYDVSRSSRQEIAAALERSVAALA
jgi:serine/threonine-protein kinase HipA